MPAKIFCRFGDLKGVSAEIGQEETVLGRSRGASLPLKADLISGQHARIGWDAEDGCYVLEDLGSTNGTKLDGVAVEGIERLGHLHVITLAGEHELIFQDLARSARRHGTETGEVSEAALDYDDSTAVGEAPPALPSAIAASAIAASAIAASAIAASAIAPPGEGTQIEKIGLQLPAALADVVPPAASAAPPRKPAPSTIGMDEAVPALGSNGVSEEKLAQLLLGEADGAAELALVVSHAGGSVQRFELDEGEHVVGRGDDASVAIESLEISRCHAVVTVAGERVTVRDLGSRNGTFVDGQAVGEEEVELGTDSHLRFGGVTVRLIRGESQA